MAKIFICVGEKTKMLAISDEIAQYLAEAEGGVFEIEDFLGEKFLNKIGYNDDLPYGQRSLSIYSSTGKYLFSSVA